MRGFLLICCLIVGLVGLLGCSGDAYGCPPAALQLSTGCQVQAQQLRQQVIVAPYQQQFVQQVVQPVYAQPLVQQVYVPQQQIVVRQHVQQIRVQQIRQPRVQVQSTRTVIRNR